MTHPLRLRWPSEGRLGLFYFAYYAALGGFSPYFAPFLETRGFSAWQIGVVMALWFGTRVYAPPLWAAAVARSRQPLRWLQAGALATMLAFAAFAPRVEFLVLVLVMAIFASFYNALMPQFEAHALARLGARRSRYGRVRAWGSLGFLVANLLFGVLFGWLGYAWLVALILPLFALLWWSSLLQQPLEQVGEATSVAASLPASSPEQSGMEAGTVTGAPSASASALGDRRFQVFLLACFLMQVAHGPFYVFFSMHLGAVGYAPASVGVYWACGVLAEIAMFLMMARVLARIDARQVMLICFLVGALRWAVTALLAADPWLLLLAQFGHAFTFAAFHTAAMQRIGHWFPGASAVHGQGLLYGLGSGAGGVIGALLAAGLWDLAAGKTAFLGACAVSLLGAVLLWVGGKGETGHGAR